MIDAAHDERSGSVVRHVALVCPYSLDTPGGVQQQVLGLERALTRLGHRVTVLAPGPTGGLGRTIPIRVNGSIARMAPHPVGAHRTRRALNRGRFDVIHLHEPLAPSITIPTLLLHAAPTVATFHAAGERTPYRWFGAPARRLARRIDASVAVSDAAAELVHRHLGVTCTVLHNGIDLEQFGPGRRDRHSRTVLFLGRHEQRKGLDVLLEAMAELPEDVSILIGGTGPDSPRLQDRYHSDPRIVWLGQVSEATKLELLRRSSVLCAPSRHGESFGVVLLEAMAAGLPVVASDLPGYRALSNNTTAARLVPPGDPAALARELIRVLSDDHLAESLRTAGLHQARRLSLDSLTERYVEIYEELLVTTEFRRRRTPQDRRTPPDDHGVQRGGGRHSQRRGHARTQLGDVQRDLASEPGSRFVIARSPG